MPKDTPEQTRIAAEVRAPAKVLARLLDSKAKKQWRNVVNEPLYAYKIPIHQDPFWFTVWMGDLVYNLVANHKRTIGEFVTFDLSLWRPHRWYTEPLPKTSKTLGFPVYGPVAETDESAAALVSAEDIRTALCTLDSKAMMFATICDTQMHATGVFDAESLPSMSANILLLRSLMIRIFERSRQLHGTWKWDWKTRTATPE